MQWEFQCAVPSGSAAGSCRPALSSNNGVATGASASIPWQRCEVDWGAFLDLYRHQIEQLATDTGWLDRAENLLLFGPSGVGKTHLAIMDTMTMMVKDQHWSFFRPCP